MKYNQEIEQLIDQIFSEGKEIEAKMNLYKQCCNFTEVLENLSLVYSHMASLNRSLPPLPSEKAPSFEVDDAYIQTFEGTE